MTDKEKVIKELKEALDSLDITNEYRLNLIRAIEYLQEEHASEDLEDAFIAGTKWQKELLMKDAIDAEVCERITQNGLLPSVTVLANGFKVRDKVKVIIINKD